MTEIVANYGEEDFCPDPKMAAYLRALRNQVAEEAEEALRSVRRDWKKPLEERIEAGVALENVTCRRLESGLFEATFERNHSRFREGDLVQIGFGNPATDPGVPAFIEREDDGRFLLFVGERERQSRAQELEDLSQPRVLDIGHLDLSLTVMEALTELGASREGRERVLPLLMGTSRPRLDMKRAMEAEAKGVELGLNWSQCEAVAQCCGTDLCALVQGPPGTGKTRVLAETVAMLARSGERVLVTSLTHRAIHNALDAVARASRRDFPVAKIGGQDLSNPDVPVYDSLRGSPLRHHKGGAVVGATPFAAASGRLGKEVFDTVVFDEASQVTVSLAVLAMRKGRRYLFFGDHKQLPPVMTTLSTSDARLSSVFGALAGRGFDTLLSETYRLPPSLSHWPSLAFYGGELESHESALQRPLAYATPPVAHARALDPALPRVFAELTHFQSRTRSDPEALVVAQMVAELLRCGIEAGEIAVIAPFRAQGRAIRLQLEGLVTDSVKRRQVVIDTVERMQGQERDVVIVSLTASDPVWAARLAEFYFQPERLNVSITRARRKLILVGSPRVLSALPKTPELQATVELLRSLLADSVRVKVALPETD